MPTPKTPEQAAKELRLTQTRAALRRHDGNRSAAAKALGISRAAMMKRLVAFPEVAAEFPTRRGRPSAAQTVA